MSAREQIRQEAAASGGLVCAGTSEARRRLLGRMVAAGEMVWLLPGVACRAECRDDPLVRLCAVPLWNPDAVVTGAAAARVLFWPQRDVPSVDLLVSGTQRQRAGYTVHRWSRAPIAHVVERGGLRLTDPAFTAVWLAAVDDGAAIETALRTGAATPDGLAEALAVMPHLPGNPVRRELVRWSQHKPWSAFERRVHRLLVDAGLTGWEGNWYCRLPGHDRGVVVDIAFVQQKVAIELDGYEFHGTRDAWRRDLAKSNALQLAGWTVLHFTWADLERPEWLVEQVRLAVRMSDFA